MRNSERIGIASIGFALLGAIFAAFIFVLINPLEQGKELAAKHICESNQAELVEYNFSSSDWFVQCQQTSYYPEPKKRGIIVIGSEGEIVNEERIPVFTWKTSGNTAIRGCSIDGVWFEGC